VSCLPFLTVFAYWGKPLGGIRENPNGKFHRKRKLDPDLEKHINLSKKHDLHEVGVNNEMLTDSWAWGPKTRDPAGHDVEKKGASSSLAAKRKALPEH
jgi:hypothetical protein